MLGILGHLDVVPTGDYGWDNDPFDAVIKNGRMYVIINGNSVWNSHFLFKINVFFGASVSIASFVHTAIYA